MDATNYFGMNALLDSARIRVDGNELLPNVPAKYFTQLQQQYHTNSNDGVYCYSFVRHPEKMDYQGGLKTNECDWMTLELIIDPNSLLSKITECNCLADSPTLCKCRNLLHSLNKDIKQKLCNEYLEFSDVIQLHVFAIKYQPVVIEKGRLSISKK